MGEEKKAMKAIVKIAILMASILLSLFVFNAIICSTCFLDVLNGGISAGCEVIVRVIDVQPNFVILR